MKFFNRRRSLFALALLFPLTVAAFPNMSAGYAEQLAKRSSYAGEVVLVRGGFNVFSGGFDSIAAKLKKRGIKTRMFAHSQERQIASSIIANQKNYGRRPIILIGHSWGANAVLRVAKTLKGRGLRVRYMATFAATNPGPASSNIQKLTNYYFKKDGWGKPVRRGRGFRGRLRNIDMSKYGSVNHFNVDEVPRLQRQVVRNVLRYIRPGRRS